MKYYIGLVLVIGFAIYLSWDYRAEKARGFRPRPLNERATPTWQDMLLAFLMLGGAIAMTITERCYNV